MKQAKELRTSDMGLAFLTSMEGIVPGPYLDSVGVWTYGIGHTKSAGDPNPETMTRGTPADLDAELGLVFDIFKTDIAKYEDDVRRAITVPVTQHEFDAAVSFHYNTGAISTATWVKTLNAGDRAKASEQIMNWTKPPEIIPRREAEQQLFRFGIYPTSKATVWGVNSVGNVIWKPVRSMTHEELIEAFNDTAPTPADLPTFSPEYFELSIKLLEERLADVEDLLMEVRRAWDVD